MVRFAASAASALVLACFACGGQIDPGSTGERSNELGRTRGPGSSPPAAPQRPDEPTTPSEPSEPAPSDLDGFVECQGDTTLISNDAAVTNTGLQASGSGALIGSTRHLAGKYFFEVAVGELQGGVRIGLDGTLDGATSRCALSNAEQISCMFAAANGTSGGGSAAPTDRAIASLDVVGVAVDFDEQVMHYTLNGEPLADQSFQFLSSDPPLLMAPWIEIDHANVTVSFGAATQYPIPDGYLPWACNP